MHQNSNRIYGNNDLLAVYHGLFNTATDTTDYFVWNKPKGVRTVQIYALGGGGGGGSGGAGANGTARGGGGGGGSGAYSRTIMPAIFLPDVLYVKPGAGGVGALGVLNSNGQAGSAGNASYVTLTPHTLGTNNAGNIVCTANGGAGGGAGTSAGAGAGGTPAASVATQATMPFGFLGINQLIAGMVGGAGGFNAAGAVGNGPGVNPFTSAPGIATGGCGGAGVGSAQQTGAGGFLTAITTTILYPNAGSTIAGNNGTNYGLNLNSNPDVIATPFPLVSSGGGGGGSRAANDTDGWRGGCGGFGSGGGGGGAINGTNVTGGGGGNGGPGFVMIISSY